MLAHFKTNPDIAIFNINSNFIPTNNLLFTLIIVYLLDFIPLLSITSSYIISNHSPINRPQCGH